jgi:predicted DCC family thiol-disulfide oxidoreductase YuxK
VSVATAGADELTVLYDDRCRLCRRASRWLAGRDQLVPLRFVPAGSTGARRRFPALDHEATLRDLTVVSSVGEVWTGDAAWLTCLWALRSYRGLAHRLAGPGLLPVARRVVAVAAAIRERTRGSGYGDQDDRTGCDDERCR